MVFNVHCLHRYEKNFPDPLKFHPERWFPENDHLRTNEAYMPFSVGPRNCVGMKFALMELKIVIAILVSEFEFKLVDPTFVPRTHSTLTMSPDPFDVIITKRS